MWRVKKDFFDVSADHGYSTGDKFPFDGAKVSAERIAELSGNDNKLGMPLIEEIPTVTPRRSKKNTNQ